MNKFEELQHKVHGTHKLVVKKRNTVFNIIGYVSILWIMYGMYYLNQYIL